MIVLTVSLCFSAVARAAEISAQLVSIHTATLSGEIAARIEAIAARVGERFRKGDVLVSFDCALPNAQLSHAQAALTVAARTLEISRRAAAQKTNAQLELDIPAAEMLKAKSDVAAAETLVSKCAIAAPFAGVTVDQKMHPFEYATPGQPIIAVLDASTANSSDSRLIQRHTMALVNMSAHLISRWNFLNEFSQSWILRFHSRPEFVGLLHEALIAMDGAGNILAVNESALLQLGCSTRKALVGESIERFCASSTNTMMRLPSAWAFSSRRFSASTICLTLSRSASAMANPSSSQTG